MSSDVYVVIELDPFLQHFLRGFYSCDTEIFEFPRLSRKNYLPYALIEALWYPPCDFRLPDFGEATFKIALPELPDKDINSMNYVSETANKAFVEVIDRFYTATVYEFFDDKYIVGFGPKDTVDLFMERHNIGPEHIDRLRRDYTRFKNWRKVRKFRKKSQFHDPLFKAV